MNETEKLRALLRWALAHMAPPNRETALSSEYDANLQEAKAATDVEIYFSNSEETERG